MQQWHFVGCGTLILSILLKCVSVSNQEWKVRPAMVNISSDKPLFYPFSALANKCSGSCVPDVVKNMNSA